MFVLKWHIRIKIAGAHVVAEDHGIAGPQRPHNVAASHALLVRAHRTNASCNPRAPANRRKEEAQATGAPGAWERTAERSMVAGVQAMGADPQLQQFVKRQPRGRSVSCLFLFASDFRRVGRSHSKIAGRAGRAAQRRRHQTGQMHTRRIQKCERDHNVARAVATASCHRSATYPCAGRESMRPSGAAGQAPPLFASAGGAVASGGGMPPRELRRPTRDRPAFPLSPQSITLFELGSL